MSKRKQIIRNQRARASKELSAPEELQHIYDLLFTAWGSQSWWPGDTPFEVIVGAILTQNCNWTNVEQAIRNLKTAEKLTPEALDEMAPDELAELIRPSGFFNVKAKRLKNFVRFYREELEVNAGKGRNLKELRSAMLEVNGVGQETVDSILLYALNRRVFVVDAYTFRILQRHYFISGNESYAQVQHLMENNLPKNRQLYNEYHALIVKAGKDHCKPTPKCQGCPLEGHRHIDHNRTKHQ